MSKINKTLFYILSFTWGLPMTLIGCLVMLTLMIFGKKPKKWGPCYCIEIGEDWGGLEFGPFFLANERSTASLRNHELGHGIQNCFFGPLMPFIVSIPSAIRYWYRRIRTKKGLENKTKYDDIWFEGQATSVGWDYFNRNSNIRSKVYSAIESMIKTEGRDE